MWKYKPGIKHQYMQRWVIITKTHFLYYAASVPYAAYLGRPLAVIPLEDIKSARRVQVDVPEKTEKYTALKNFQFEIFVKEYDDMSHHSHGSFHMQDETYTSPLKEKEIKRSADKRKHSSDEKPIYGIGVLKPQEDEAKQEEEAPGKTLPKDLFESPGNKRSASTRDQRFGFLGVPQDQVRASSRQSARSSANRSPVKSLREDDPEQAHHLMPKPSPRKRLSGELSQYKEEKEEKPRETVKRKIHPSILKAIKKLVKDEAQRQHLIKILEESLALPVEEEHIII